MSRSKIRLLGKFVSTNDSAPKSDESKKPGESTDKSKDKYYFAYRPETMLRLIKAIQMAVELEECLKEAVKFLVGPDTPPNHPAAVLKLRCDKAIAEWQKGVDL
jgi:hypothetical protein